MIKILIIEDEATIREDLAEILHYEGFQVIEADSGKRGIEVLEIEQPDLILCDLAMPEASGYEVLDYVRSSKTLLKLPFIFLTARTERNFFRLGMELGADDYISKPVSKTELLSAIQSRLNRYQELTDISNLELDKAKKRLTRLVSHELRTPLVSISMVQQIISNRLHALSSDDIAELMDTLQSGSNRLQHLVEQMVLMTQIDTSLLNKDEVQKNGHVLDAWIVVQAAVATARQFAYRHPHGEIYLKPPREIVPVHILYQALRHALAEIVANALDFSPPGSKITIAQELHKDKAWITITDQGSGLTTNRLRTALVPFEQIDRERHEQQGMGLGLPLAKTIIELHDGEILFRPTVSSGTQVIFQLPVSLQV
ncbi:MAG: response regulator [Aggregatilineales bacterium]